MSFAAEGADREVQQTDAWLAECSLLRGEWGDALARVDESLAGGAEPDSQLSRIRGIALAQLDAEGAREALDESLRLAEAEGSDFERALTLQAVAALFPEWQDAPAAAATASTLLERLGVVRVATPPIGGGVAS